MKVILDQSIIERTVRRLSYEIIEKNKDLSSLVVLGIPTRGMTLAKRIVDNIEKIEGIQVPLASLDVRAYRDDEKRIAEKNLPNIFVEGKTVILVDDVLFTGRTVRAAMDAVIDIGRPAKIHLAVLIDRGHREFPISANFVGKNIPTAVSETVRVKLLENDGVEEVVLG